MDRSGWGFLPLPAPLAIWPDSSRGSRLDMSKIFFLTVFLFFIPYTAPALSSDQISTPETQADPDVEAGVTKDSDPVEGDETEESIVLELVDDTGQMVDETHSYLSMKLVDFIDGVDLFFGEDRMEEQVQGSYLRFAYGVLTTPDGDVDPLSRMKINVHMPRLQRRLNLMIETDREADSALQDNGRQAENTVFAGESGDVSTAFRYLWQEKRNWKISADAGVLFTSPLDKFVRLRFRRNITFADWNFRFSETLFWYDLASSGESTLVDIEIRTSGLDLFRISTEATWTDTNEYFDLNHSFSLFHDIDKKHALVYQAGANGLTEPDTHVSAYYFNARWRKRMNRKWFYAEIKPEIRFREEDQFRLAPSLTLMMEAFFGNY